MTSKKTPDFWKVQAAGNDFILYFRPLPKSALSRKKEIREACARHTGIGADGVIYVHWHKKKWFWNFFNADATETNLCGNAARALALWIAEWGSKMVGTASRSARDLEWQGRLGLFRARRSAPRADFEVTWPLKKAEPLPMANELLELFWQLNERGLAGTYLYDVGVPHLVLLGYETWNETDRMTCNAVFRSHPSLGPAGANVTWLELSTLNTVTFERGVERETLACGSGALAAYLGLKTYRAGRQEKLSQAALKFPGGTLRVRESAAGELWLGGPAQIVFYGECPKK